MSNKAVSDTDTDTVTEIDEPSMFKVVFLNDDYTPMDFVTKMLRSIFKKSADEARLLTAIIHDEGKAVAGIYTFEIAETKAIDTMTIARKEGFPLRVLLEKE